MYSDDKLLFYDLFIKSLTGEKKKKVAQGLHWQFSA